ncbi:UDP-N-acetylglucosamine 1-carboxyvinyltransferase [Legionella dresdenensis]|uniref:UDP-N-acetylglucosamine 1-carboxyvinyltransferase n=1 Tax=Legionella dresdenensis TaxID=450200 RepID=A0ABV8CCW6_9GAMM
MQKTRHSTNTNWKTDDTRLSITETDSVYEITGGIALHGEVRISGSKNAALPLLAATLLADQPIQLDNLPAITDISLLLNCLKAIGKQWVYIGDNSVQITHKPLLEPHIPAEFASKIRGSIVLLGPLLARCPKVILPLPGGCAIGKRPVDLHIMALKALGADIIEEGNYLICTRQTGRLKGNTIHFKEKTVTGTENAIMAASLADGETCIQNAAREPEVVALADFLNQLGANIKGAGTDAITIIGVEKLNGCSQYPIIPDRIEAGTFLIAAAITQGCITIKDVNPQHLTTILKLLLEAGAEIQCGTDSIKINMQHVKSAAFNIVTQPFPGFPTDLQSLCLSLATIADGQSVLCETLFESRFQIVEELLKMGAKITIEENTARITGVQQLKAARVKATDLRSGAALVCAGLAAQGTTQISGIHLIERGYEDLIRKLTALGAQIQRIDLPHCPRFFTPIQNNNTTNNATNHLTSQM